MSQATTGQKAERSYRLNKHMAVAVPRAWDTSLGGQTPLKAGSGQSPEERLGLEARSQQDHRALTALAILMWSHLMPARESEPCLGMPPALPGACDWASSGVMGTQGAISEQQWWGRSWSRLLRVINYWEPQVNMVIAKSCNSCLQVTYRLWTALDKLTLFHLPVLGMVYRRCFIPASPRGINGFFGSVV